MGDFAPGETPFTGRKMLITILVFFGVIIAVNLTMLTLAVKNFGGLVVKNSYVASQNFNDDLAASRAQPIHGWDIAPEAAGKAVTVAMRDLDRTPLSGLSFTVLASRPTHRREDVTLRFDEAAPGVYESAQGLAPGIWHLTVLMDDGQRRTVELIAK